MLQARPLARGRSVHAPWLRPAEHLPARVGQCGPWRLSRMLGAGRWTRVYQARPTSLPVEGPADYAIKALRAECEQNAIALAMLKREASIARQVSHPQLAPVLWEHLSRPPYHLALPY